MVNRAHELLFPLFLAEMLKGIENAKKISGQEFRIFEGFRSPTRQNELWALGRTAPGKIVTRARGWQSWHQFGLAADIALWKDGKWSWDFDPKKTSEYFLPFKLTWGGINDGPHYQWRNLPTISEANKIHETEGVIGLWQRLLALA